LGQPIPEIRRARLLRAMPELKLRPKTLAELATNALFLVSERPIRLDEKATQLSTPDARALLAEVAKQLEDVDWRVDDLERRVREFASQRGIKLGAIAQPLRAALTGSTASPGIFVVMEILGREETLGRIADAVNLAAAT